MKYVAIQPQYPFLVERLALFAALMHGVQRLAQRSRDLEAMAIVDFLGHSAVLGVPMRGSCIGYYAPSAPRKFSPRNAIFLALIKKSDIWLVEPGNPALQFTHPGRFAAIDGAYYRSTRSIYLSADWEVGEFWQSLLLFHEAIHAYDHIVAHRPKSPMWRAELHARRLEYMVLAGVKGKPFVALLDSAPPLKAIDGSLKSGKHLKLFAPTERQISDAQLDQLFGPGCSLDESHYRRSMVGRCLVQRYLEQECYSMQSLRLAMT